MRSSIRKRKIQNGKQAKNPSKNYKKNLYFILLCLYQFRELKDLLFLKNSTFLNFCEVSWIDWKFDKDWLTKELSEEQSKKNWPFQYSCALNYKASHYGEIIFYSSHKLLQNKKSFLKKVSSFTASALYFLENRETMKNIKSQWGGVFDSFSQAFCITKKDLDIIRYNRSFQKIVRKTESEPRNKKLFEVFPFPESLFKKNEETGSFLFKKNNIHWKVSFKTLFLKKESTQAFLFLIKDITKEMEAEEKLSSQAKDRELGFIKGSIAHELNNPIAGMQILLEVLEQNVPQDKTLVIDSLKEMKKSVFACQEIIRKILLLSKDKEEKKPILLSH